MRSALKAHWPEYLMEAAGLAVFMISACMVVALLEHPASPVRQSLPSPFLRRALIGIAMGLTAIAIVYSPWGKQSGAHLNPSLTLTFFRLGKVHGWDAFFYVLAQFVGGLSGVLVAAALLGVVIRDASVNYAVTVPGSDGTAAAFVAELLISFLLMTVVLKVSNTPRLARYTGLFAGTLVATYITLEAPLSGMSMNPARSLGSALPAHSWTALWVYFTAPPLGMLLAAELMLREKGVAGINCAKLHHQNNRRCIFCEYRQRKDRREGPWSHKTIMT
jgi:aquaporin Z